MFEEDWPWATFHGYSILWWDMEKFLWSGYLQTTTARLGGWFMHKKQNKDARR